MLQGSLDGDGRKFFFESSAEWPPGSSEPKPANRLSGLAVQALEDGRVLAVHGQHLHAMLASFAHDNFARHDEDFLGGHGNVFARANSGERRLQAGRAHDGDQHNVRRGEGGELEQAFGAGMDLSGRPERVAQLLGLRRGSNGNPGGPVFAGLLQEQFHIIARAKPKQADLIRQVLDYLDGAGADGAGAAEENEITHLRFTIYDLRGCWRCGWFWRRRRLWREVHCPLASGCSDGQL